MSRYPWTEATLHYARALGAARSGQLDVAREAVARLNSIQKDIKDPRFHYWAAQVDVQRRTASAWLALAEGRRMGRSESAAGSRIRPRSCR
jgi:hypothetical protein